MTGRGSHWLVLLLAVLPVPAAAWETVLTGSRALRATDSLESVVAAPDGDVFIAGRAGYRTVVMRVSAATGETVWSREVSAVSPALLLLDEAGDLLMSSEEQEWWGRPGQLVKLDGETGVEVWRSDGEPGWPAAYNLINDIAVEPGGNLVAASTVIAWDGHSETDFLVVRVDGTSGTQLWSYRISGVPEPFDPDRHAGDRPESTDRAQLVAYGTHNDVIAAGSLEREDEYELTVVALDLETGVERWRYVDGGESVVSELVVDNAGDVLLTSGDTLRKLSGETGVELWRIDGPVSAITVAADGDIITAGSGPSAATSLWHLDIRRLDADGHLRWSRRLSAPHLISAEDGALVISPLGDIFVGGILAGPDGPDLGVLKLAGDTGVERWRHLADGDGHIPADDFPSALVVTPTGDVVVIGAVRNVATGSDMLRLGLSAANGALLWRHVESVPPPLFDWAARVVTGPHGEIVAVGTLSNDDTGEDFAAVSLAGASGLERWRLEQSGTVGWDGATLVALDDAGDVLAAGQLGKGTSGDRISAVLKVNGLTGEECWRGVVASSVDGAFESIGDVLTTADGDVLAVGGLERRSGPGRFAPIEKAAMVFRFDGATGTERWRRRIGLGVAGAAVLDGAGDVVISASEPYPYERRYLTKLSADSRRVAWQRRMPMPYDDPDGFLSGEPQLARDGQEQVVMADAWLSYERDRSRLAVTAVDAASGAVRWQRVFPQLSEVFALVGDAGEGVLVATSDVTNGLAVVLALDGDGIERWRYRFTDAVTWRSGMSLARAGNDVVAAGAVDTEDRGWDIVAAKLDGTSGELLWHRTLDGPAHGDDWASSVTVDVAGDVVIAGASRGAFSDADFLVVKLLGADGSDAPVGEDTPLPDAGNHCVPVAVEEPPTPVDPEPVDPEPVDPDPVDPDPVDPDPTDPEPPTEPPTTGVACLAADGADRCPDNDVCNGVETCDLTTGQCSAGTPLVCDDGDPCTVDDVCDPASGCVHRPLAAIPLMQCRADGRLPIPSCETSLPRRVRRPLARLQRILERLDASAPPRTFERIERLCRRARHRLARTSKRRGGECVSAQQAVLADVCGGAS